MVCQVIREHPKRTVGWLTVIVLIILCFYYGTRARGTEDKQTKKLPKWQKCVTLHESQTNITTIDEYAKFDFHPKWMNTKEFWDESLQKRYEQFRANKTKPNLKVILVPFSHNDPGWLKTFTEYFEQDTRLILDSVIEKMEQYENMTFVWAEMSFLQLWWDQAASAKKRSLKNLIQSGRFEIVTGGWVMADEASSHVYGLINQLIEGHEWLRENLNYTPTTGFSIDPFGHGSTLPYLLAASGFDGTIIQRVHFAWKQFMAKKQYDDFYWTPYWDDGTDSQSRTLLTHNMPFDIYSIEGSCGPHPRICRNFTFPESQNTFDIPVKKQPIYITEENIEKKADQLVEQYAKGASLFPHNIALIPLGSDFDYKSTISIDLRFTNYKLLADYVNAHPQRYNNTHISFGLPRDYFAEIKKRYTEYPHLKGDFFVYADIFSTGRPGYWSGYYTTRPMYKMLDRELEHNLRSAEILFTIALNRAKQRNDSDAVRVHEKNYEKLVRARRNSGLFQHHDGITGTSMRAVMQDYGSRLSKSNQEAMQLQESAIEFLLQNSTEKHNFLLSELKREAFDKLPTKVPIEVHENRSVEIVLFNTLVQPRIELISVHTTSPYVKLFDDQGKEVKIQINPKWNFTTASGTVSFESINILTDLFELQFVADLPPLALVKYIVKYSGSNEKPKQNSSIATVYGNREIVNALFEIKSLQNGDIFMENRMLRLICNGTNGLLKSITYKNRNKTVECGINFSAYRSALFRSGAYLMETDGEQNMLDSSNDNKTVLIISGPLTTDVKMVYGDFITHTIRIFKTGTALDSGIFIKNEIDFDSSKNSNTEFVMRFETNISNGVNPIFFTDQNGFQYLRREKVEAIGVEGNYYPITSGAFIQDKEHRLTLLTTHAQGAASLQQGFLEVMMDRRTIYDDGRGMGEGVTDSQQTHQTFWLVLEEFNEIHEQKPNTRHEYETPSHFVNQLTNIHNYPVNTYIVDDDDDRLQLHSRVDLFNMKFPCDVHLTTLRTQSAQNWPTFPSRSALLLAHRQSSTCKLNDVGFTCENYGGFITKSLNLAEGLPLSSVESVSLTGTKLLEPIKSFDKIYIKPMDIVSFRLNFV